MKISALQFYLQKNEERIARTEIDPETLDKSEILAVYILKQDDLAALKQFKDLLVDRGTKHPAKGLSRLLIGHQKIPFILGKYRTSGQLTRSLRTLLENVFKKGEKNKYIVGIDEPLFRRLWGDAGNTGTSRERKTPAKETTQKTESSSQLLWELLPHCEEPPGLTQRYMGNSIEVKIVRQLIMRAAETEDKVLILGDTGTGKELVARAIHDYGKRKEKPFIVINCSAIPGDLLESELFGHKKGAYTNAFYDKEGMWKLAHEGTLFLDEIGDLSFAHQAKILRALQEKKILPIGEKEEIPVNARIIAATNKDLYAMTQKGQFREDLYYRLREFLIYTPSLHSHPEDITLLAQSFWRRVTHEENNPLASEIIKELQYYRWPGNVRELKQTLGGIKRIFGTSRPRVNHLKGIFLMDGHMYLERKPDLPQETAFHSLDSFGHLRRAEEVVRAGENICRSLIKGQKTGGYSTDSLREMIQYRISELEVLCSRPVLFSSEDLFFEVHKAKGKLTYFKGLLEKDQKQAMAYLKEEVMPELAEAGKKIMLEIKTLMEGDLSTMSYTA